MSNNIDLIRTFRENFYKHPILSVKGKSFDQRQLIDLIQNYWDSLFLDGDWAGNGLYLYFYNIVKFPTRLAAKMIDFDTKDFRFFAEDGQSYVPVYFFNKELKAWMKEEGFGLLLNEIVQRLPKYGNVVLKVVDGSPKLVDLETIVLDPKVKSLHDSSVFIEEHLMTPQELLDMKGKWDAKLIDQLIKEHSARGTGSYLKVSEIYHYADLSYFDGSKSDKYVRGVSIVADLDRVQRDSKGKIIADFSKTLFKGPKEKLPYYEFFWEGDDNHNRWLRKGVVEDLIEEQIRHNDAINLEAQGLIWTSKHLFQTRDMMVSKNLLTGVENGDIMRVNSEITPIAMEERNLAAFQQEYNVWSKNVREKTFAFESVSGETLPSGTPFRLGFIQQNAAGGYHDFKRETLGLMLKRLIVDVVAPTFLKQNRNQHIFNYYGEDSEFSILEELHIEAELYKELTSIQKQVEAGAFVPIPSQEEVDAERQRLLQKIRSRPFREVDIPANFYDDLKYRMDLLVTNENVAVDAKIQSLMSVFQTIATNPGILQNPVTKRILFRILDYSGVSPEDLRGAAEQMTPTATQGQNPQVPLSPPPGAGGLKPQLQLSNMQTTL